MKDVNPHHLEAARLALGRAALDAGKLAVLAAIDERTTFRADQVVVKVDSDSRRLEHELAMMAAAGGVGLPLPSVFAFESGSPGVLLMRHMPGEALRPAHGPQPVRDAGRLLRGLHALPAERREAWDIHVSAWAEQRTRHLVERRLLHADAAARIRSRVEDVRAILADRPCRLIHGDLQSDHVLVLGGRITAFLDLADAGGGDPLIDLAVVTLWEPSFEELLWQGYEPDSQTVTAGCVLLPLYRLLRHLGCRHLATGAWDGRSAAHQADASAPGLHGVANGGARACRKPRASVFGLDGRCPSPPESRARSGRCMTRNESYPLAMAELRSLQIVGRSGQLGNVHFPGNGRRVALVLPGFRGGWMTAAVYYPVLALQESASEVICMESIYSEYPARDRLYADAAAALQAARAIGSDHGEVIAGKSLGTVQMAELMTRGDLGPDTPTIWLTPLLRDPAIAGAIASLTRPALVVIGTDDHHYDHQQLRKLSETGHQTLVLDCAHHGLAITGDAEASARIPSRLVAAVRSYLE